MIETIASFVISFFITYLTLPLILILSKRYSDLLKEPNQIDSHSSAVTTYGGVAIFFGVILSFFTLLKVDSIYGFKWIIGSLLIVFILGIIDDSITLRPLKKFLGQLIAISILVFFNDLRITSMQGLFMVYELPYSLSVILTILTMIVITNAYNLIDGIDGLASMVGILVSFVFLIFFYINGDFNFVIILSAKIFMGDTGSLVIGFVLSIIAIQFVETNFTINNPLFEIKTASLSMAILVVPLFDLLRVFIVRIAQKKSPFSGDRNHLHHLLMDNGLSQIQTSFVLLFFNSIVILAALFLGFLNINYILILICGFGLLFLLTIKKSK